MAEDDGEIRRLPVDGTLDLHTFQPREIKELIPDYLAACRERGIFQVRIVHGKGTGALRTTVQALLSRMPGVREYRTAGPEGGGWGATIVHLKPITRAPERGAGRAARQPGPAGARSVNRQKPLGLKLFDRRMAISRFGPDEAIPAWAGGGSLLSITRTASELSIVCAEEEVPDGVRCERGWRCVMVDGPLDFSETGILVALIAPLADAGIAVFVVSTFDTDYILVKDDRIGEAVERLVAAGHHLETA